MIFPTLISLGIYFVLAISIWFADPPQGIFVTMDPAGSVAESVSKVFTCQLNNSGSNPPSELTWTQLDSAGALLPMEDVQVRPTDQIVGEFGALIARSVLSVIARRTINGRRFECAAIYQNKKMMLRAEEILEVKCKCCEKHALFI